MTSPASRAPTPTRHLITRPVRDGSLPRLDQQRVVSVSADQLEVADLPRDPGAVWAVELELVESSSILLAATRLVVQRVERAGAALILGFRLPSAAPDRVVRLPALPLGELVSLEAVAVDLTPITSSDRWCYLTDHATLVLPSVSPNETAAWIALQALVEVGHCPADDILDRSASGAPQSHRRAVALEALRAHADRVVREILVATNRSL